MPLLLEKLATLISGETMDPRTSSFGLIERCKSGDLQAFEGLFQRYQQRLAILVHYKLSRSLRRHAEVDDILQEVFLLACRDLKEFTYRSPGSFFRWLARIADHVLTDAARYASRRKRDGGEPVRFRSESNPHGYEPVNSLTPSRILRQQEAMEEVLARLDRLPEDYRQILLLAKFEGLTTPEISERMGKSREQAALLLHRALKRFRELA